MRTLIRTSRPTRLFWASVVALALAVPLAVGASPWTTDSGTHLRLDTIIRRLDRVIELLGSIKENTCCG